MSSSVFYKFKNSKEPERIVFDGTDISVFELKREIIISSGLGDGLDFDFHLYPEDQPTTEYDDDTTLISRSSTVIAVRRPAPRGHGRAARYVTGRAPVRAIKKATKPAGAGAAAGTGGPTNEQDAEAAFLAESAQVWDQQKATLSTAKNIRRQMVRKPNVSPENIPVGYVCYRCNKKGHWIQDCPTNNDPDFKPTARAKRTTGIPRSFLKTVEKPADDEDARGIMLNADGEYVQVMTDTKTWEKFQEKAIATKAQAADVDAANKEARERGLECPIDKRMFVDPVKTPCCEKTYCHDCIENALADGDLVCPNCSKDGVLIDDLVADEEMVQKVKDFEAEKAKQKLEKEQQASEQAQAAAKPSSPSKNEETSSLPPTDDKAKAGETSQDGSKSPKPGNTNASQSSSNVKSPLSVAVKPISSLSPAVGGNGSDTDTSTTSKKRKDAPTEIKPPTAPKAMRQQKEQQDRQVLDQSSAMEKDFLQSMEALKQMQEAPNANTPLAMGAGMAGNPMMGMPQNMNAMNGMNGMNMNGMNGMNGMHGMNGMNGVHPMAMNGMNQGYPMNQWNGYNQGFGQNGMGYNNMNQGWNNGYGNGQHQMGGYNGMMNNNMNGSSGWGWNQNQGFQQQQQQQGNGNMGYGMMQNGAGHHGNTQP